MTPRDQTCFQCGSRIVTDESGELVESALVESPCLGCERLIAILEQSAALEAATVQTEPEAELVDLSSHAAILARLRGGRQEPDVRDFARLAANDVE